MSVPQRYINSYGKNYFVTKELITISLLTDSILHRVCLFSYVEFLIKKSVQRGGMFLTTSTAFKIKKCICVSLLSLYCLQVFETYG